MNDGPSACNYSRASLCIFKMNAGNTDGNFSSRRLFGAQQILPVLPVVTDDILVRRLKNRERQRRYRARKRLESDMKRSCLLGQSAAFRNESQFNLSNLQLMSCERPFGCMNIETTRSETRVYSGRNWKREARETHSSSEHRDPSSSQFQPMRSTSESGTTLYRLKDPNKRRNWKADARSKHRERCKEIFAPGLPQPNPCFCSH